MSTEQWYYVTVTEVGTGSTGQWCGTGTSERDARREARIWAEREGVLIQSCVVNREKTTRLVG